MGPRETSLHQHALHVGSQFESLLAETAAILGDLDADGVEDGIEPALERIASFLQIDACFLVEFTGSAPGSVSAFWYWGAVRGAGEVTLPAVLGQRHEWLRRCAESGEAIAFGTESQVPESFRGTAVCSLAILPLGHGAEPVGCLGLAMTRAERAWAPALLRRVRLLGDTLTSALLRRRAAQERQRSARFEGLLSDLTAALLEEPSPDAELEIEDALHAMAEVAGADRALLFRVRAGGTRLDLGHSWSRDPADAAADGDGGCAREPALRWLARKMAGGEDVAVTTLDELPENAARERRHFRRLGTRSLLRLPLSIGGSVVGVLGLDAIRAERDWPEDVRERLRLGGRMLAWAIDGGNPQLAPVSSGSAAVPADAAGAESALLPSLERLPAGSSILVLGDTGRGKEIVLRAPLEPHRTQAAWELADVVQQAGAIAPAVPPPAAPPLEASAVGSTLQQVAREHVLRTLAECGWKINGTGNAADRLGLKPSTLRYRMMKLGIERPGS